MAYFTNLFSPETHAAFTNSSRKIAGFRPRQRAAAGRVAVGDKLLCYLTGLSRWVGMLEVTGSEFESTEPIFAEEDDPYVVRLAVKPVVWLEPSRGIPTHVAALWNHLSFTKGLDQGS